MDIQKKDSSSLYNPWYFLSFLVVMVVVGLFIFNFFGFALAFFFVGFDLSELLRIMENPLSGPETRVPLLVVQGVTSIGTFIFIPWLYQRYVDTTGNIKIESRNNDDLFNYVLVILFTLAIMPFTAKIMEWNLDLHLPSFLSSFEERARATHDFVEKSTQHLISLNGPFELILGLIVVAVLPAVGEEYLFRGFIQKYLIKGFGSIHLGILITAILFGVFHLQIFVLLPRILLGLVYGYFYHYSRNLFLPIVAHFANNSIMVSLLYMYNQEIIDFNIEDESQISLFMALTSFLFSSLLFFYLKWKYQNVSEQE